MNRSFWGVSLLLIILALVSYDCSILAPNSQTSTPAVRSAPPATLKLPEPRLKSEVSVEEAMLERRSVREYTDQPLTIEDASQLLWAAQGITAEWGGRTAPSAGALYPLELYLVVGNVTGLATGVYKYRPENHALVSVKDGDVRADLAAAALNQMAVKEGALEIVIAAAYERVTGKYGDRGVRYVHMEAGHAAQNICLQATALYLGTVTIGAFYDDRVESILSMPPDETPIYVIPVGKKKV